MMYVPDRLCRVSTIQKPHACGAALCTVQVRKRAFRDCLQAQASQATAELQSMWRKHEAARAEVRELRDAWAAERRDLEQRVRCRAGAVDCICM